MKFYIVTGFTEPGLFNDRAAAMADLKTRRLDHEEAGYGVFKGRIFERDIDLSDLEMRMEGDKGFYVASLRKV